MSDRIAFPTKQVRSEKTRLALLEAAKEIIASEGVDALSIAKLSAKLGLTKGAFYARFPNKDALLHAITEDVQKETENLIDDFSQMFVDPATPLSNILKEVIGLTLKVSRERWSMYQKLSISPWDKSIPAKEIRLLNRKMAASVGYVLEQHKTEFSHPSPTNAANLFNLLLDGMCTSIVQAEEIDPEFLTLSDEILCEEIYRAISGYIGLIETGSN